MILESIYELARKAGIGHISGFGEYPDAGEGFYYLDLYTQRNTSEAQAQIKVNVAALKKLTDEIEVVDNNRIVFRFQDAP